METTFGDVIKTYCWAAPIIDGSLLIEEVYVPKVIIAEELRVAVSEVFV